MIMIIKVYCINCIEGLKIVSVKYSINHNEILSKTFIKVISCCVTYKKQKKKKNVRSGKE